MIHDNYNRLTDSERLFIDVKVRQLMHQFRIDSLMPYGLLGDDRAEVFVEAFATWLTESAQAHGLKRDAIGVRDSADTRKRRELTDEELVWGLEVV